MTSSLCVLNVCPFDFTAFVGVGKCWPVSSINHTSVAVVTPTDRCKSVRNC